ncbi:hypothetical protein [Marisediminicola sp. LYQ85]|uniref:hypothetical protein n=1 Tax=Marisediminicola sp. LYQ85 TaxID=3391062 RepID=UPI003982E1E8
MTNTYPPTASAPTSDAPTSNGTVDSAKEQAANVGGSAADAAGRVAGVAKDEASNVAREAKSQISNLVGEAQSQLRDQAGTQQTRVASGLRSIGDELTGMADSSEQSGVATEVVRQVASRADGVATWLDDRDPGSLLDEVTSFARRRPGTFIAIAAVAGILAGRLTRSLKADAADSAKAAETATPTAPSTSTSTSTSTPVAAEPTPNPAYSPAATGIYDDTVRGSGDPLADAIGEPRS